MPTLRPLQSLSTLLVIPFLFRTDPGKSTSLSHGHIPQMFRAPELQREEMGRDPGGCQPALSLHLPAGRKMRVYQREEASGSREAHAVFLEPGQAAGRALNTEEPGPLEPAGPTRAGLEGPERRRFSASELMTWLHSSLRLARNSAARALTPGSGTGAAQEGTGSSSGPHEQDAGWALPTLTRHLRLGAGHLKCGTLVPRGTLGSTHPQLSPFPGKASGRESRSVEMRVDCMALPVSVDPSGSHGGWPEARYYLPPRALPSEGCRRGTALKLPFS